MSATASSGSTVDVLLPTPLLSVKLGVTERSSGGTCSITASQADKPQLLAATPVTQSSSSRAAGHSGQGAHIPWDLPPCHSLRWHQHLGGGQPPALTKRWLHRTKVRHYARRAISQGGRGGLRRTTILGGTTPAPKNLRRSFQAHRSYPGHLYRGEVPRRCSIRYYAPFAAPISDVGVNFTTDS